jgi:hypothetical protein
MGSPDKSKPGTELPERFSGTHSDGEFQRRSRDGGPAALFDQGGILELGSGGDTRKAFRASYSAQLVWSDANHSWWFKPTPGLRVGFSVPEDFGSTLQVDKTDATRNGLEVHMASAHKGIVEPKICTCVSPCHDERAIEMIERVATTRWG